MGDLKETQNWITFPDLDPRLADWPFMRSATYANLIILVYLVFVKMIGPAYMKHRQPYQMRRLLFCYNLAVVAWSVWMFYKFGKHGWFGRYRFVCEPVNYSVDDDRMGMVQVCWHFFFSKIIELLDTVFFVLRKKQSQITFLHVSHHVIAVSLIRYVLSHGAGGYNSTFGFANTFVHIWMYSYYALAALGPAVQKFLWWKKYLTALQMIQFVFVGAVMLVNAFLPNCETNLVLAMTNLFPATFFLILFYDFYKRSYLKDQKSAEKASASSPVKRL